MFGDPVANLFDVRRVSGPGCEHNRSDLLRLGIHVQLDKDVVRGFWRRENGSQVRVDHADLHHRIESGGGCLRRFAERARADPSVDSEGLVGQEPQHSLAHEANCRIALQEVSFHWPEFVELPDCFAHGDQPVFHRLPYRVCDRLIASRLLRPGQQCRCIAQCGHIYMFPYLAAGVRFDIPPGGIEERRVVPGGSPVIPSDGTGSGRQDVEEARVVCVMVCPVPITMTRNTFAATEEIFDAIYR